jgi:dTDP-4-dehydrorhamnose 3,5-epimerase-like enzyme
MIPVPFETKLIDGNQPIEWDRKTELKECILLKLPIVHEPRGNLTFVEGKHHIPFNIARVYYLYDIPGGADRGGHAHKNLEQFIVAMSGSFDIHVTDGKKERSFHLNRSYYGLYIPKMVWRYIDNFSSGSVCLVMASDVYKEEDYIRNYNDFMKAVWN